MRQSLLQNWILMFVQTYWHSSRTTNSQACKPINQSLMNNFFFFINLIINQFNNFAASLTKTIIFHVFKNQRIICHSTKTSHDITSTIEINIPNHWSMIKCLITHLRLLSTVLLDQWQTHKLYCILPVKSLPV